MTIATNEIDLPESLSANWHCNFRIRILWDRMAFRDLTKTFVNMRIGAKANHLNGSFNKNSSNGLLTVRSDNHTVSAADRLSLQTSCHNSKFLQSAAETTNWKAVQDSLPPVSNDTIEQAEALTPQIQSRSKSSLLICL